MLMCRVTLFFFGGCVLGGCLARRAGAEDGEAPDGVHSARCTSRCLTLHITQLAASFRNLQNNEILGWCESHRRCAQCLQPCKELWESRRDLSHKPCEKHHECVTSSEFLRSIRVQKQGDCPPPQKASGFAAACVESCAADRDCAGTRKCCPNGCGHTCQTPANLFKGEGHVLRVPLKPRKDMSFSEDGAGLVEVSWKSRFNVSVEPVLHILQRRWNYGIHPSEDEATPWQTVCMVHENGHSSLPAVTPSGIIPSVYRDAITPDFIDLKDGLFACSAHHGLGEVFLEFPQWALLLLGSSASSAGGEGVCRLRETVEDRALLRDLRPHRWYQFRVSAVNAHGTRGFTTPSKHFLSSRDPIPPEPPRSIRSGNVTAGADGRVNVVLRWDPPREEDLAIRHYRVSWGPQEPSTAGQEDKMENSRVTEGVTPEIELEGLQPSTSYLVQVQAIAYWVQKRLKSVRSQFVFTTPAAGEGFSSSLSASESREHNSVADSTESAITLPWSWRGTSGDVPLLSSQRPTSSFLWFCPAADPTGSPAQGGPAVEVSNELPSSHTVPGVLRLETAAPHYHNNQLQVKVFWKTSHEGKRQSLKDSGTYLLTWYPELCAKNMTKTAKRATVQGTHFVITGLMFACKYRVAVKSVSAAGQGSEVTTSVATPQCSPVRGKGAKALPCARGARPERPQLARKVAVRPEKLTAAFRSVNGSVLAEFRWRVSPAAPAPGSLAGFQLSWVQLSSNSSSSSVSADTAVYQSQLLSPDQPFLTVGDLQPGSLYEVRVRALSPAGRGPATVKSFHTPPASGAL
ncbi:KALM protein, partial [Atractosteus spatula]|nr:KALM protein [Atractosteus spatula]